MSEARENSYRRGYNRRWQKYRQRFLAEHPLCADHLARGHVVAATVVDHITPHRGDRKLFWDPKNHQSLCEHCHNSAKQREEKSGRVIGCDVSGMPLDPKHHWHHRDPQPH